MNSLKLQKFNFDQVLNVKSKNFTFAQEISDVMIPFSKLIPKTQNIMECEKNQTCIEILKKEFLL